MKSRRARFVIDVAEREEGSGSFAWPRRPAVSDNRCDDFRIVGGGRESGAGIAVFAASASSRLVHLLRRLQPAARTAVEPGREGGIEQARGLIGDGPKTHC